MYREEIDRKENSKYNTKQKKKLIICFISAYYEVKLNFKEMEKSSGCQEDFSMHYSSLAYNLYVFIQMLWVDIMGFNRNWKCI